MRRARLGALCGLILLLTGCGGAGAAAVSSGPVVLVSSTRQAVSWVKDASTNDGTPINQEILESTTQTGNTMWSGTYDGSVFVVKFQLPEGNLFVWQVDEAGDITAMNANARQIQADNWIDPTGP